MMEAVREYDAKLDSKKRLTLRGSPFAYYHVAEMKNGTIVLEPRELTRPFQISERTLAMMDLAMANLEKGIASEPIDLSDL